MQASLKKDPSNPSDASNQMTNSNSLNVATLNHNKIGELDTLTVKDDGYRAVVLLQGAQLIHFITDDVEDIQNHSAHSPNNWLWVSEKAEYKLGSSVRGGVPICWPIFGQFTANPKSVQNSFADGSFDFESPKFNQHGYARLQNFELDSFETFSYEDTPVNKSTSDKETSIKKTSEPAFYASARLILTLQQAESCRPHLTLKVKFEFSPQGFQIVLMTQNNSDKTVYFSQALHTYLPTTDITQTSISGFDELTYSDTLTLDAKTGEWQTKTQQGNVDFKGEVDRIYHSAPDITLNTPAHTYELKAEGSNSTVVWNPWINKAKTISQFAADDYQRMLCIETANAHLDVVKLRAGEAWEMGMRISRSN